MKDRVSQYPGRVKLTPVSGQENVYDMEWADGATVVGTALNKANLLTDATASSYGLSTSATPNSVFSKLKDALLMSGTSGSPKKPNGLPVTIPASSVSGITDATFVTGTYTGDGTSSSRIISLGFQASAVFIETMNGDSDISNSACRGLALLNSPIESDLGVAIVEITTSGFTINYTSAGKIGYGFNNSSYTYYYIAFK